MVATTSVETINCEPAWVEWINEGLNAVVSEFKDDGVSQNLLALSLSKESVVDCWKFGLLIANKPSMPTTASRKEPNLSRLSLDVVVGKSKCCKESRLSMCFMGKCWGLKSLL